MCKIQLKFNISQPKRDKVTLSLMAMLCAVSCFIVWYQPCQMLCFFHADEGDLKDLLPTDLLSHDEDLISMLEDEDLGKTTTGKGGPFYYLYLSVVVLQYTV